MLRYQISYHARRNCRPLSKTCKRVTLETTTEQELMTLGSGILYTLRLE